MGSAVFVLAHGTTTVTEKHVVELDRFTDANLHAILRDWLSVYDKQHTDPQGWRAAIEAVGKALWDELIGPVHERLGQLDVHHHAPVVIMPQGGLGLLPLHAAWCETNGERRYFLDHRAIFYAPSGSALHISRQRLGQPQRQRRSLLAVVNPTGDLTHAVAEGQAITGLFEADAQTLLVEAQATVDAVRGAIPTRSYIHFAGHGAYDWRDPMRSGLRLSGGRSLTLADVIADLDLGVARLVTLSACETGLTDISQSVDEYLGLPAGFLQAGAPSVISSLWPVDDRSTALLMRRFYACHLELGMPPAQALREAQLWLRDLSQEEAHPVAPPDPHPHGGQERKVHAVETHGMHGPRPFSHPYYWAGFTLTGA
jgi:CHAT domain-containing protein